MARIRFPSLTQRGLMRICWRSPRCRPNSCKYQADGKATTPRTNTRTGSGGSMCRHSGTTYDDRVLPFHDSKEDDDEKACPPVAAGRDRAQPELLWSNSGETWCSRRSWASGFEVYGAILNGRKAIGIELKPSYFKQAVKNVQAALVEREREQVPLFCRRHHRSERGRDGSRKDSDARCENTWKPKAKRAHDLRRP